MNTEHANETAAQAAERIPALLAAAYTLDDLRRIADELPGGEPFAIRVAEAIRIVRERDRPAGPRVGDLLAENTYDIPDNVLEVVNNEGDTWRRPVGDEKYVREDLDGSLDYSQEYDWVTVGGWASTEGLLAYAPLRVTKVKP